MEVYPVVVGDLKGSMDRTVFYKVEDRCFGRKKNQPKEREFSNEEQEHHLKFGFVGRLAGRVRYVLRECLWNKPKHLTLPNYFVRLNFGNCMVEDLESLHRCIADAGRQRRGRCAQGCQRCLDSQAFAV